MNVFMHWRWICVACLCGLFATCGDDEDTPKRQDGTSSTTTSTTGTTSQTSDTGTSTSQTGETTGTSSATSQTGETSTTQTGPIPCDPECDSGPEGLERCLYDGTCVPDYDRLCVVDEDCREGETCEGVGRDVSACIRGETPIEVCPGGEGCEDSSGELLAGASARVITPGFEQPRREFWERSEFRGDPSNPETFWDCGLDQLCPGDPGYTEADFGELDGVMQGAWIAGFSSSRPAMRYCADREGGLCDPEKPWEGALAHDDVWARTVVVRQGDTTVAIVALDAVGYFYDESQRIQESLDPSLGVDLVLLSSTHTHEGPDTMGQWGPTRNGGSIPVETGAQRWWLDFVNTKVVESIEEAAGRLEPVRLDAAMVDTGTERLGVEDSRDPWVFDDDLAVLKISSKDSGETLATIVNWSNHPEALGARNPFITSDFPGPTREYVENGLPEERNDNGEVIAEAIEGTGGIALFISGAVGGLITPLRGAVAENRRGERPETGTFAKSDAMGQQIAMHVLAALENAEEVQTPALGFASREITMPIDNIIFHGALFSLRLFDRKVYNATDQIPFDDQNRPAGLTRVSIIRIGNVTFFSVPGEIFPELVVGGYSAQGSYPFTPVMGDPRRVECGEDLAPITCTTDEECPEHWSCWADRGACRPEGRACGDASACREGELCDAGVCKTSCDDACGDGFVCRDAQWCVYSPSLARSLEVAWPCLIDASNPNPPDLSAASTEPALKEKMPGDVIFLVGLGHDELGYIVPPYDFEVNEVIPYLVEVEGDHYEETNSTGPDHYPVLERTLLELLDALSEE